MSDPSPLVEEPAAATAPPTTEARGSPAPQARWGHRWAVLLVTLAVFALHLWLSRRVPGPSVILDEAGYLGNARWLSGHGPTFAMPVSPSYGIGYPLLLVPLQWAFPDPDLLWRSVLVVNAALLASLVPLLATLGRRLLGLTSRDALLAAGVGALVPAATGASVSALSENLALPLIVATTLAFHRALRPGPIWRKVWFGPAVALLVASHPRFTTILGVAVVGLGVAGWRRLASPSIVALNLGGLVALTLVSRTVQSAVLSARWSMVDSLEGDLGDGLDLVTTRTGWADLATSAAGQGWYLAVGTLGLTGLGIGLFGALTAGRRPGRVTQEVDGAGRLTAAVTLVAAAGVFATSVFFFTRTQFRADHIIYGRHNETFSPIWVTSGVALLIRVRARRELLRWLAGTAAAMALLTLALRHLADPTAFGGTYAYFSVPSISRVIGDPASGTYLRATLMGGIGLLVIALGAGLARHPRWLILPLAAWFAWSGMGRIEDVESFAGATYDDWDLPAQVERLRITEADLDADATKGAAVLSYQFFMPDVAFDLYEPKLGQSADGPYVFAPREDVGLPARGGRVALLDDGGFYGFRGTPGGMALWVLPGPEQDRLAEEGLLLPSGFPTELPAEARHGEIEILDRPGSVEVAPGGAVTVTVRGRHTGTGSPWPDAGSYRSGPGRVRIIAGVTALDPEQPPGARSGGELPSWIEPGDGFTQEITVFAVGEVLQPLPPGRYRVAVGVGQDEPVAWLTTSGPDSTFTMVVTEG